MNDEVRVRREATVIPTYEPAAPDRNPMFLEKRVYQGSSGRVYPLPFIGRIAEEPTDRAWEAVYLDNGLVEVMLLPEIGGRIHAGRDLTNGYDFFYRQNVIKPALVGLAGPWASGGVEFNWPQHHRPSTFMPTDVHIEHGEDGSVTVWMSEHEPMNRMKGMHGVCLHPGRNAIEVKVRLFNRTQTTQTFLWWANIACRVHQAYQSFFPPDAHMVADHAKRATSRYPLCDDHYYGVDYGARGREGVPVEERPRDFLPAHSGGKGPEYAPDDLSWYANIPVPTSYMCMGTDEDFFGGYDQFAGAGLLHVADRHISPGKKQWTWGNHEFGYAWDRNLTDADGPYIELMAGVYTDNQPDFSFLAPGETRTFSQFFYPYQAIGPVQYANLEAAISIAEGKVGVAVTQAQPGAVIQAFAQGQEVGRWTRDLHPGEPFLESIQVEGTIRVSVQDSRGIELAVYENAPAEPVEVAEVATEPPLPTEIESADELYFTGLHLEQYRHATRDAAAYYREALRRDPGDARCNNALGLWHFRRGEFTEAECLFRRGIERITKRNPNPYDGEPYYNLGLVLRFQGRDDEAYNAFAKAAWNAAWQAPAHLALAEICSRKGQWTKALDHVDRSLRRDSENLWARNLRALVLRERGQDAEGYVRETLAIDPLYSLTRVLLGESPKIDNATRIDFAIDLYRAGFTVDGFEMLDGADLDARDGTAPMVAYYLAHFTSAPVPPAAFSDYCFPSRLEDIAVLRTAMEENPDDALAPYLLGNLLYDRRRHEEAIALWQRSVDLDPANAIAHRNLGIGAFNILHHSERAMAAYEAAVRVEPNDGRLFYERDQLAKRVRTSPEARLAVLRTRMDLVRQRDDLTLEFVNLLNAMGEPEEAAKILDARRFQPWEGGEGMTLGAFSRTHLRLAAKALSAKEFETARDHIERVLHPPQNLGEARHLLANASDVWLVAGDVYEALGETDAARSWWKRAAEFRGDFQEMSVRDVSELSYFQALALDRLGRDPEAKYREIENYADEFGRTEAKIDYFATSLPTMLLFEDDLQVRQGNTARFMLAQAALGLGHGDRARSLLDEVLRIDPNHAMALDFRSRLQN
ncbi:DUF5107 domain-containing protein [bacterium]|nr:MAG: DUF5107 domain-containing protein [bacterium]